MLTSADKFDTDIHTYLKRHENKQLLRFVTVGSVDDGKSTLIGRLLFDTGAVYIDQLEDATTAGEVDLARITDGLLAEREQGITIDVAYRYFTTSKRKFIIADTPGHVQYTRNMATGASTADLAIILIDARLGVLQQSRRHAYIASLLGIPHLAVAVNKMDLMDFDEGVFRAIEEEFRAFCRQLDFHEVVFFPVSALDGDNCVHRSEKTPWYDGPTVLEHLETADVAQSHNLRDFRFPVQLVVRPHLDYRGFAGQVASGIVRPGDAVKVLPAGTTSRVQTIDTWDGELERAFSPQSVMLRLEDEIDASRGDLIVKAEDEPLEVRTFDAMMVWMAETPLDTAKSYLIKHCARYVRVDIPEIRWKIDLETLGELAADALELNDIGRVTITTHRSIVCDPYRENRATGAFVVIDSLTNNTVGAGMILDPAEGVGVDIVAAGEARPRSGISPREREGRLKQLGGVVWLTGQPASGKSSLAYALERRLFDRGYFPTVLDADEFGEPDTFEHERAFEISEVASVAQQFAAAGVVTICAFQSPHAAEREVVKHQVGEHFVVVHVDTPANVCRERDLRDLYTLSEAGRLDQPLPEYETPSAPDVTVSLENDHLDEAVAQVFAVLKDKGILR